MFNINPKKYSYAFRLGTLDCYKVRTGICSLHLTETEYQKIYVKEEENKAYLDGYVAYCRSFSNLLIIY